MSDLNPYEEGLANDLAKAQARIEELEADLRKMALDYLAAQGQAADAYQAQLEAEAKLAALTSAAIKVHDSYWNSTDGVITGMYDLEWALRLAELKGEDRG